MIWLYQLIGKGPIYWYILKGMFEKCKKNLFQKVQ